MATREQIQALCADGWAVVPVVPRAKRMADSDWRDRVYTPDDFSPTHNVGNKNGTPSGGRIDLDCDAPEAIAVARAVVPATRVHGRASKPRSHYWFIAEGTKTKTFKDIDGAMLVEVRGTGSMTVLPPSIHESGEAIVWEDEGPFLELTPEEVMRIATHVAVGALLARHWPGEGSRHEASGHIGGLLARAGWDAILISKVVQIAAKEAGDPEWRDRARFAKDSAIKFANGDPTTGGPRLREILGNGVVDLLYRWLDQDDGSELDELNAKHFCTIIGSTPVVGTEPRVPSEGPTFQRYSEFIQRYYNRFKDKKKLGQWWLEHPARREYDRVVFAPPHAPVEVFERDYNLWQGFVCEPYQGSDPERHIERFLLHTYDVIASGNEDHGNYVCDLLADCVQRPGDPVGKALALRGPQGRGKSIWVEAFGALFGRHFLAVSNRERIVGRFNAHLSGKVVVFADEAIWGGNKSDIGTLKHLVTQRTITIERKGIDTVTELNCIHLFLATNEDWVWPAGANERRGVILDVTTERPRSYFEALVAEIRAPLFLPALLAWLQAREIDYAALRAGLDTEALHDQQDLTGDAVQQWWRMILDDGYWMGQPWPDFIPVEALYLKFIEDMGPQRGAGYTYRGTRMQMIRRLRQLLPQSADFAQRTMPVSVLPGRPDLGQMRSMRGLRIPPLAVCRQYYNRVTGVRIEWPPVDETPQPLYEGELEL